ncbi:MAG: hypothetical protein DRI61_15415, partial [Chloroflexi bacterium]
MDDDTLVLEGHCYDEGPEAEDISDVSGDTSLSFTYDSQDCSADFSAGDTSSVVCDGQVVGFGVRLGSGRFSLNFIGANLSIEHGTVTKIPDHLDCVSVAETPTDCNVHMDPRIQVSGQCYDGNKVKLGDYVEVVVDGGSYNYSCESGGFKQVPVLHITRASRSDIPLSATSSFTPGEVKYYIGPVGSPQLEYQFFYKPGYELPLNLEEGDYELSCTLLNGQSMIVGTFSSTRLDEVTVVSFEGSREDLSSEQFRLECSLGGPANERGGSASWTYSLNFEVDDQGVVCDDGSDCFNLCLIPVGEQSGRCSSDINCLDETTWEPPEGGAYLDMNGTYTGACSACGGYWVTRLSMNSSGYYQPEFDKIVYYSVADRNPNGHVECDSDGCVYSGTVFDRRADDSFDIGENSWVISGSTVTLTPGSYYTACPDDPKDACRNGKKVVDVEVVSGSPLSVDVYSSERGFCLGNQANELKTCDEGAVSTSFPEGDWRNVLIIWDDGSGVIEVASINENGVFPGNRTIVCSFPGDYSSCMLDGTSLDGSRVRVITGGEVVDRYSVLIPFGSSQRTIVVECSRSAQECHANSADAIPELFPGERVKTITEGVKVEKSFGGKWDCVKSGSYLWVPKPDIKVQSYEVTIPDPNEPPYSTVGLKLGFGKPVWPDRIGSVSYSLSGFECSTLGGDLELTYPEGGQCDGSSSCTFESHSLDRSTIVDSCLSSSPDPASCTLSS